MRGASLRRLPPLDAGQDISVVVFDWAIFHTGDEEVGRALGVATIEPTLGDGEPFGAYVIALEVLAADGDAFGASPRPLRGRDMLCAKSVKAASTVEKGSPPICTHKSACQQKSSPAIFENT